MPSMTASSLVLLYAAVFASASYVPQEVLSASPSQDSSAVLRRVAVNSTRHERSTRVILDAAQAADVDIWHVAHDYIDLYMPSESRGASAFSSHELEYTDHLLPSSLLHPHKHPFSLWNLSSLSNTTFHEVYHPLGDIETFASQLLELYPRNVRVVPIGHSAENREMFALEIAKDFGSIRKKTGFVITGAQHAREWIATSTAMFIAHALLADQSESYSMAPLLNSYVFYLVLVPNPDGYAYTWETDRLWYKNRQIIGPNERCIGLDMNRNWVRTTATILLSTPTPPQGHKWKPDAQFPALKKNKGPVDPCSYWYPGHRAFESPEVNNIANYITTLPNLRAYIDLRSYGQMISAPFSHSCKKVPKDAEDQIEAALGAAAAIKAAHGVAFTAGSLCQLTYRAGGNVVDYMYAKAGIKYSFAVHLRDTGTYGFLLPAEWIRPVGEETANMIKSLASFIVKQKF
ncbi:hypothetical protein PHLGIDRAFT_126383 [Phlebiopsis gigantea 11061_1 CR5-6]|uniref:Inactive metallocarboxypeptidase ECM14 n=1 Tax=Phlebiopsis gigantea (strain 11061_1 CR5-6) TaxID=745531 RepID=A0A0C3S2B4_PHLG1|nr:hypothetical protein PHLGIDRAFT_126383 [Phlebiopsis gigantea 11061_1 CR5-6]